MPPATAAIPDLAATLSGQAAAWPICARGTARVLVSGLYRRTAPHVDAGRNGQWAKGQVLTVWAEQGDWVLLQDLQTNTVAWSHRGTTTQPYLEVSCPTA